MMNELPWQSFVNLTCEQLMFTLVEATSVADC